MKTTMIPKKKLVRCANCEILRSELDALHKAEQGIAHSYELLQKENMKLLRERDMLKEVLSCANGSKWARRGLKTAVDAYLAEFGDDEDDDDEYEK